MMSGNNRLNNFGRRRFFEVAAGAVATVQLAQVRAANAEHASDRTIRTAQSGSSNSPPALSQIRAGVLDVGYIEAGSKDGPAVFLLHGWPYDIHSFGEVTPRLASAGFRVIVPYARGYGSTSFLSGETPRTGQPAALAVDAIALMDALDVKQAIFAGFDWGARTAAIVAALWPDRASGLVSVSGYLIGSQQAGKLPLPPKAELQWWYQYYFATERGREGYQKYRREPDCTGPMLYGRTLPNAFWTLVADNGRVVATMMTAGRLSKILDHLFLSIWFVTPGPPDGSEISPNATFRR